jgi:predicted metal-dependent hydrolase
MAELYFEENPQEPTRLSSKGSVYDLEEIYNRIKAEYFSSDFSASIGWSDKSRTGKRRSITFGTYDRQRRQIRINRCLDSQKIPPYFVEFVVYHEMLHGIYLPITGPSARTQIHTPEFKAKERLFAHFAEAKKWEKMNVKQCMTI